MLPYLRTIRTPTGLIGMGSNVQPQGYIAKAGTVTSIFWSGSVYCLEINGKFGGPAHAYRCADSFAVELTSAGLPVQTVSEAAFEVWVAGEQGRVYFASTAQQAIALVAALIGLSGQSREVAKLEAEASLGPVKGLQWISDPFWSPLEAFVRSRQVRRRPRYAVGAKVQVQGRPTAETVTGYALYENQAVTGGAEWHYAFGSWENGLLVCESQLSAAIILQPEALSYQIQALIASKRVTTDHVAQQMRLGPRSAKRHFRELQSLYGQNPEMIHLALYSGADDLMEMVKILNAGEALVAA